MDEIKYFGFYDSMLGRRSMSMAAVNKMNYICQAISSNGKKVRIIACGMGAEENIAACEENIQENISVKYFNTKKSSKYRIFHLINLLRRNIILFKYIIKNVSENETIIVYHSLALMRCLWLAKKIKKFRMVLEVEEIYNDVILKSDRARQREVEFIQLADAYVFPTGLLNSELNKTGKPYVIIHGTYKAEPEIAEKPADGKIHIVYAGTFDPRKGGGLAAAAAAEYLPYNYHVHILGFGSDDEIKMMKDKIEEVNAKSEATVTYDGLLSGAEYTKFLQSCDIGLSTQNPDAAFNATSFPSKILSYMANGLRVVSIRIPAISESGVGSSVYYYDTQTPQNIAEAIKSINLNDDYNGRVKIIELDKQFRREITQLIE